MGAHFLSSAESGNGKGLGAFRRRRSGGARATDAAYPAAGTAGHPITGKSTRRWREVGARFFPDQQPVHSVQQVCNVACVRKQAKSGANADNCRCCTGHAARNWRRALPKRGPAGTADQRGTGDAREEEPLVEFFGLLCIGSNPPC